MKQRVYSVFGLMLLAVACSGGGSGPKTGSNTPTDTGGADGTPTGGSTATGGSTGGSTGTGGGATGGGSGGADSGGMGGSGMGGSGDGGASGGASGGGADGGSPNTGPGSGDYSCTLVIGIAATAQWFNAGFEKMVDGSKWEVEAVHSGFIQTWADPNGSFWGLNPSSACTTNAKTPDRVIQVALWLHWMPATVDEWVKALTQVVENWKAKNKNLKRLELATFVRSPDMKPCPGGMEFKSYIRPEQDMAYEMVAAKYPGLVYVAPKWEVKSCADFGGNPPHFSGAGATNAATQIANYYNGKTP